VADFEIAESHAANADTHEFQDFAIDGFDHAAHLTVAALGDGDFEVRVLAGIAHASDFGGARGAVA
jgi:hypothetical protein